MSLESSSARCEQIAQHLLVYGTPFDPAEVVRRIEAVDGEAVRRAARRIITAAEPTFTAIGPIGRVAPFTDIRARLGNAV
jgi:predicted Zn-dependent peptidase